MPHSIPSSNRLFPGHLDAQFVTILRKVLEDFDFLMSTVALPQTIRCLFDAHADMQNTYMFVQIMNPALEVWRAEPSGPQKTNEIITLQRETYIKVLYRQVDVAPDVPLPPIVASWQSDTTVNCVEMSEGMMVQALQRLSENSMLVPECYRHGGIPGFTMSYLY